VRSNTEKCLQRCSYWMRLERLYALSDADNRTAQSGPPCMRLVQQSSITGRGALQRDNEVRAWYPCDPSSEQLASDEGLFSCPPQNIEGSLQESPAGSGVYSVSAEALPFSCWKVHSRKCLHESLTQ